MGKHVFYIHTNIVPKNEGKNARNNFYRNTRIVRAKNFGKKIVSKKCENTFFIFTRISCPKNRGKKRAKQFFQKHTKSASKKFWEKYRLKKVRKHVFCFHTKIVTKKWGGKNARNNFSRNTRIVRAKNVGRESSEISPKTSLLYAHEYRVQKIKGKKAEK